MIEEILSLFAGRPHLAFPVIVVAFIALEFAVSRLAHHDVPIYDLSENKTTIAIVFGKAVLKPLEAAIIAVPFMFLYEHRLFDFPQNGVSYGVALLLGTEFCYYWFHRASHRIRWFWATHSVHHSPRHFNLGSGLRLGWTGTISGNFVFYLPLAALGFHPLAITAMLGINLAYQFFLHTEFGPRLGPLEWLLNTPTHHKVHHASNETCLDCNYGGILIVFDRMFGTFRAIPGETVLRYGLAGKDTSGRPMGIVFQEWVSLFRDLRSACSWRTRLRLLSGPPGKIPEDERRRR